MHFSTYLTANNWQRAVGSLVIIAWLYLNIPALTWLFQSFRQASSFNLVLISLVLMVVLVQIWRDRQQLELFTSMRIQLYPLLLMLGCAISAIALQWLRGLPACLGACSWKQGEGHALILVSGVTP